MSRTWKIVLVVAAVLALVALVFSVASANMARADSKRTTTKTVTRQFTRDYISLKGVNLNPKGGEGDELVHLRQPVGERQQGRA
jgi:hypothetical protein